VVTTVGVPAPAVTATPQSTAMKSPPFGYSPARPRNMPKSQGRPGANPVEPARTATTARSPLSSLSSLTGIGRRSANPATESTRTESTRTVTPLGQVPPGGSVSQTNFNQFEDPGLAPHQPFGDQPVIPPPPSPFSLPRPVLPPGMNFPSDRQVPPMILGSHLRLQPGETATERSLRLMSAIGELEKQVDALGQQNAEQNQLLKQRDDQLLMAIREIKSARKEVSTARDELERLRLQVKGLQDKVQNSERDSAALLQTLAPLVQKLLEPEAAGEPVDGPEEQ
jgi:hypothetical protein